MKRYAALGVAAVILFGIGWFWGRATAPAHFEEHVRFDRESKKSAALAKAATATKEAAKDTSDSQLNERIVRKYIPVPGPPGDCPKSALAEETIDRRSNEHKEATREATSTKRSEVASTAESNRESGERLKLVIQAPPPPRLHLAAYGRSGLDWKPEAGGEIGARLGSLLGVDVWAGASVDAVTREPVESALDRAQVWVRAEVRLPLRR
jgi:hypothetical protein